MKQKIVVKLYICCDKSRTKAMKIASSAEGVLSVSIQGNDKDEIAVIGVGVDSATLCTILRKKLGCADLKSVEEVKDPKPDDKKKEGQDEEKKKPNGEKKDEGKDNPKTPAEAAIICHHYPPNYNYPPTYHCYPYPNPPHYYMFTTYEDRPNCTVM